MRTSAAKAKPYEVLLETLGRDPAAPPQGLELADREPEPWESGVQATCECLSWRGALDNLERRQAEDELGETIYAGFPVEARSAVVTAHSLLDKGVISEDELQAKMKEVRERFERA
jgi:hypothetical protein